MGPSLPCGHSLRKGRKDWLTEPWRVSGGWCEPGGWVAAWLEAAVGLSQSLIWSCTPQHPQLCACGQEPPARGQWPEWGWGSSWPQQSSLCPWGLGLSGAGGSRRQSWGLCLSPRRLPEPPRLRTVPTCLKLLPVAFALVSELQLCKCQPFLCPTITASAPQTLGQHILLLGGLWLPFSSTFCF